MRIQTAREQAERRAAFYTLDDMINGPPPDTRPVVVHPDGHYQELVDWVHQGSLNEALWRSGHKTAAVPQGLNFRYYPGNYRATPRVDAHVEGVDWPVGSIHWQPEGNEVEWIDVHPDYRLQGIGRGLFDYAKKHHAPDLHHSDDLTDDGQEFSKHVGAVPGVIHRGLTLDLDSPRTSPQLRSLLQTHGPESPEFISELLRNGTGTYWSRDKGFAESVNPGNGLQVALSADWDGNDADQLHPELTRNLPDSWGDMSLLAPAENPTGEFNLKPNKELNVRSVRVRKKGEPSWREILRQPVRARTAALRHAMPMRDAWDTEYTDPTSERYLPNSRRDIGDPGTGPMWHADTERYGVGDIIEPNKGYFPSPHNQYYEDSGNGYRQNWVWMDEPDWVRNTWGKGNDQWIYEVEPLDEGPWPWNGQDAAGYVAPRVRVKDIVKHRTAPPPRWQSPPNMVQRLHGPQPPNPNEDLSVDKAAMVLGMCSIGQLVKAAGFMVAKQYDVDFYLGNSPARTTVSAQEADEAVKKIQAEYGSDIKIIDVMVR